MSAADKTFGGRYAVIERVGSGGMAEVYRARDELLGREVALKVLHERYARDRSFVERFRREAQSAANLNHPNVVSLFDYGSDEDSYYIVMELIEGRSLAEIISEEGPILPERAAEITSDVAKALERAHGAGLVHRDVKPSNIMITSSGQTKVTDFGIARALGGNGEQTMTQTGMVIGTASYLSPEQAQGDPVDARSDVYSLGVVLYEMLTGRPPFTGDTPLAIAYKHVRENPAPPSSVNPDVPESLDAVAMKALAKNPDNRYSSAVDMAEDLGRFLAGQSVRATPLLAGDTMVAPAATTGTQVLGETVYEEPVSARRAALYASGALVILALFGLLAWWLAGNLLGGEPVEVPRVIGMQEAEAVDVLEEAGLEVDVDDRSSRKPEGQVIAQDPAPGETAETGDTVTIAVSSGVAQTTVPELVGLTLDDAREAIAAAHLKVEEVITEPNEEFDKNVVFRQFPTEGSEVDRGTGVTLFVSEGEVVAVPNVEGQTESDAIAELDAAGLEVAVNRGPSDEVEEGRVISQDPSAGAEVPPGSTVTILVSEGPEAEPMPDVTGEDGDEAEEFLEAQYGLVVDQVDASPGQCGAEPPGIVCAQDPPEGTPVQPGDAATLYVQPGDALVPPGALWALVTFLFGLA